MTAIFAASVLWLGAAAGGAVPQNSRLAGVRDFAFALGVDANRTATIARLGPYDLAVVDGQQTTAASVGKLHADGKVVLGYLSVGTIERFRPWFDRLKRYAIGYWHDWDEFYARVDSRRYRRYVVRRVARKIEAKGFDGLFLDSTDMIELYPRQTPGMTKLVRRLSRLVHDRGDYLFTQNGDSVIDRFVPYIDGWNREDVTWSYSFAGRRYFHQRAGAVDHAKRMLERLGGKGLLVTSADYTRAGDAAAFDEAVANSCAAGAVPFVSDIGLTRIPPVPPSCP